MNNVVLSTRNIDDFISDVANEVVKKIDFLHNKKEPPAEGNPLNDLIPQSEAMETLGIKSEATMWRLRKNNRIKGYPLGGKIYYKRSELLEALTAKK